MVNMKIRSLGDVYRWAGIVTVVAIALSVSSSMLADYSVCPQQGAYFFTNAVVIPSILAPPVCIYLFRMHLKLSQTMEILNRLSREDGLTGLLNRRAFLEQAEKDRAEIPKFADQFAFLIDIDHFKRINDTYGHAAGDEVIREVARRMSAALGADKLLSRIGGEEFATILPTNFVGAQLMATQICETIRLSPMLFETVELKVTVSVGVALCGPNDSIGCSLSRADAALYSAKHGGRDRYVIDVDSGPERIDAKVS